MTITTRCHSSTTPAFTWSSSGTFVPTAKWTSGLGRQARLGQTGLERRVLERLKPEPTGGWEPSSIPSWRGISRPGSAAPSSGCRADGAVLSIAVPSFRLSLFVAGACRRFGEHLLQRPPVEPLQSWAPMRGVRGSSASVGRQSLNRRSPRSCRALRQRMHRAGDNYHQPSLASVADVIPPSVPAVASRDWTWFRRRSPAARSIRPAMPI